MRRDTARYGEIWRDTARCTVMRLAVTSRYATHDTGADGATAFAHGKAHAGLERDRMTELEFYLCAITGTEHALREQELARYIRGARIELRRVTGAARSLSAAFLGAEQRFARCLCRAPLRSHARSRFDRARPRHGSRRAGADPRCDQPRLSRRRDGTPECQ